MQHEYSYWPIEYIYNQSSTVISLTNCSASAHCSGFVCRVTVITGLLGLWQLVESVKSGLECDAQHAHCQRVGGDVALSCDLNAHLLSFCRPFTPALIAHATKINRLEHSETQLHVLTFLCVVKTPTTSRIPLRISTQPPLLSCTASHWLTECYLVFYRVNCPHGGQREQPAPSADNSYLFGLGWSEVVVNEETAQSE